MDLQGKIALVTGGARRVGAAISLALAQRGCDLAIHCSSSLGEADDLAKTIRALGRRAEVFRANLAEPGEIASMFGALDLSFGRLDILVNNAAVYNATPIDALTPEQWDAEFAVNARAPALCIRHAIDLMSQGGSIINIADIQADKPRANYPAYCASKAALISLAKACAKALAGRNICVNAVSPGIAQWSENSSDAHKQAVLKQVPMNRPGTPRDIASAVVFLASQNYITGQNLRVDGGWCTS